MNKKFLLLAIVSVFLLAACKPQAGTSTGNNSQSQTASIKQGQPAPNFSLESFDGPEVSLADLKGKPVLIDFWAGWCPFCVGEMPQIEKISQEFGPSSGGDLVVLGIHRTETESVQTGADFAKETGVTYPLLKDVDGSTYKTYGSGQNAMPLAVFIDKEGNISKLLFGPKTEGQMRENVEKIL